MNYALGKRGFSRAGACQVVSVRGVDTPATAKTQGTTWLLRVLGVPGQDKAATPTAPATGKAPPYAPPTAGSIILAGTKAKIEIGDFSQDVTLALKSVRLEFKATSKDAGLFQVLLDPKTFVHRVQTNVLTPDETGIPQAITTKQAAMFPFAISITNFAGETGRVIVPDRTVWTQQ